MGVIGRMMGENTPFWRKFMKSLSKRDNEILNEVVEYAKSITAMKTSAKNEKELADIFLRFVEHCESIKKEPKKEVSYIKTYIATYRNQKALKKKQNKEIEKTKSEISQKRKMLNSSKFGIGGLFTKDLSKLEYDEKICYEALLFALVSISGYSEFLAKGWSIEYRGLENNNGIHILVKIPKQHKKENGEIQKYRDYVFILFYEKNGKLDKLEMFYRSFDYQRLDDKGQAKKTDHTKHPIPPQVAHYVLSEVAKLGVIEYDPLSKTIKRIWGIKDGADKGILVNG